MAKRKKSKPEAPPEMIRGPSDVQALEEGCYFDEAEAERPTRFTESFCCLSQGQWAGRPFILQDHQRDYNRRLYGWRRPDGRRRFKTAYKEIPKKNGKSTEISARSLYHGLADREPGAEVYINAYDLKQARTVFDEAARMVRKSRHLKQQLRVIPSAKTIYHAGTESKICALSKETEGQDGLNPSYSIFDELHRQATPEKYELFEQAGAARRQYLLESITTAGYDRQSVCWRVHDYSTKVNSGIIQDTSHLGVIYAADPDDDFEDPATWRKANPSLGVTIRVDDFRQDLKKALNVPSSWNSFLRYRFNIWTNASERFLRRDRWDDCGEIEVDPETLFGQTCYVGLDLSTKLDLTAAAYAFPSSDGTVRVVWDYWVPEEAAIEREKRDRVPYLTWARQGFITMTPGDTVDYDFVRARINERAKMHRIAFLGADPWNATQLMGQLQDQDGIPVQAVRQGFLSLSDPTKELERLVISRKLAHGRNPVSSWCADNAVATKDPAGNLKLDKSKSTERIDGLPALVNALAGMANHVDSRSIYETGVHYL